jgi:hypothetical protein
VRSSEKYYILGVGKILFLTGLESSQAVPSRPPGRGVFESTFQRVKFRNRKVKF